jgi:hypothetical protein
MVYIKIFNRKLNKNILIGNEAYVNFEPKDWNVENPHVVINIENFDFYQHTFKCDDCKSFYESFGTETLDWYIEYLNKIKRLDLKSFGNKSNDNHFERVIFSDFFTGTKMKLNIHELDDDIEALKVALREEELSENYEKCIIISCLINEKEKL